MFFTFSIGFQMYFCAQGEMIDLLAFFKIYFVTHPNYLKQQKMHFLHPDHFPVTQIEVKIYF